MEISSCAQIPLFRSESVQVASTVAQRVTYSRRWRAFDKPITGHWSVWMQGDLLGISLLTYSCKDMYSSHLPPSYYPSASADEEHHLYLFLDIYSCASTKDYLCTVTDFLPSLSSQGQPYVYSESARKLPSYSSASADEEPHQYLFLCISSCTSIKHLCPYFSLSLFLLL